VTRRSCGQVCRTVRVEGGGVCAPRHAPLSRTRVCEACGAPANPENNCGVNTPVTCGACTTCDAGTQGRTCTGNPTGSQYYCGSGTCKQCSAGQTWTGTVCASPQCGASGTDGLNCPSQAPLPTINNYYCGSSSGQVANPGVCCPVGTAWNGLTCFTHDPCVLGATNSSGAICCSVGARYGYPSWNDYVQPIVY
jgi:hypothetical protein